jgi:Domain of unknown function (DUF5916)/Carbohydrate family 9 binding domain-like
VPFRRLTVVLTLLVVGPVLAAAQQSNASVHPVPPPVAQAASRSGPIVIDGKLDDAAWQAATPITDFHQSFPNDGQPPSDRTEVRVLYDDDAFYLGARMYDSKGAKGVHSVLARRDQLLQNNNSMTANALTSDYIAIVLDPYHNHLDRFWFQVNPDGVRGEHDNGDASFDPVWEAAGHVDSLGWTAEMRIPYSQLRFSRDPVQTWGLQIWRYQDRLNESDMWAYWRLNENGGPSRFGHLTDLHIPHQRRSGELLPYVVTRDQFKYAEPADPFHESSERAVRVGADAKYLLTSNLTLDATVNPDFGQVEVDPAVVNLSAFETFFEEKRPFFVANSGAFSFGNFNCYFCDNVSNLGVFYSRRIGRAPQLNGYVANNSLYSDLPENTRILGAAKITGRTSQGYTIGVLDAVTDRETAHFVTTSGGPQVGQEVEPFSNYFVGRVRKDFRQGATRIGFVGTSVVRNLDDSLLSNKLRRDAHLVGVDVSHAWSARTYSVISQFAVSDVRGSDSSIFSTQLSSARYYQRPDRHETSDALFSTTFDPARTQLNGYAWYARLAKDQGDWLWETAQNWRSPGFEVNDMSFLSRADYKWMMANVARQFSKPSGPFQNVFYVAGAQAQYTFDGDLNDDELHGGAFGTFRNFWNVNLFEIYHPNSLDDRLARGGPMLMRYGYNFMNLSLNTDARKRVVYGVNLRGGWQLVTHTPIITPNFSVSYKPASNVFVSFSPTVDWSTDPQQYVTTVSDPTATAFYGSRYVYAQLASRTISLDTRASITFTPNLTLELFTQPFFSSGEYSRFREFAAPRSLTMLDYGTDVGTITYSSTNGTYTVDPDGSGPAQTFDFGNPDFSFRSLRGNAVLRWEYRPGSTMFFVWTQERSGVDPFGDFSFGRERRNLFADRPQNVFLVKVNYWIGG